MAPVVQDETSDAGCAFSYVQQECGTHKVEVDFCRPQDQKHWLAFLNSRLLNYYVGPFALPKVDGRIRRMNVVYLVLDADLIDLALIEVTIAHTTPEGNTVSITSPLILRCPSACVLIVLRAHGQGARGRPGTEAPPRPNNREQSSQGASVNNEMDPNRPREFVVFVQHNRRCITQGYPDTPEVPSGRFERNKLTGPCIDLVEEACGITLIRSDLDVLANRWGNNRGLNSMPGPALDNVELYLYRKNISERALEMITEAARRTQDVPDSKTVKIISLGQAWKATTDLKSLAALFFFHEYRYYRTMPRYVPPTDSRLPRARPRTSRWIKVSEINPRDASEVAYHIRGRLHTPVFLNETSNSYEIMVGDETGVVALAISDQQRSTAGLDAANSPVCIQNATIETVNGRIRLSVVKDGSIIAGEAALANDPEHFDFSVKSDLNISAALLTRTAPPRRRGGGSAERRPPMTDRKIFNERGGPERSGLRTGPRPGGRPGRARAAGGGLRVGRGGYY